MTTERQRLLSYRCVDAKFLVSLLWHAPGSRTATKVFGWFDQPLTTFDQFVQIYQTESESECKYDFKESRRGMRSGAIPMPLSTRVCSRYICYIVALIRGL
jgi:hypothetical protein